MIYVVFFVVLYCIYIQISLKGKDMVRKTYIYNFEKEEYFQSKL